MKRSPALERVKRLKELKILREIEKQQRSALYVREKQVVALLDILEDIIPGLMKKGIPPSSDASGKWEEYQYQVAALDVLRGYISEAYTKLKEAKR